MPIDRLFISTPLVENQTLNLVDEEAHHLFVLRAKENESFELVNGCNQLAEATLLTLKKGSATLRIEKVISRPPPKPEITLLQALPRFNHLEWIVEKSTELNCSTLILFPGEKSEKKSLSEHQVERLKKIMIAAMKQCGRLDLPKLVIKPSLSKWAEHDLIYPAFFGDLDPSAPALLGLLTPLPEKLSIVIGPESGFSESEIEKLKTLHAKGIKLSGSILRTETAPLAALSVIGQLAIVKDSPTPL